MSTDGIVVGEQLDVILHGEVFQVLRNDAARCHIHLVYTRLHLSTARFYFVFTFLHCDAQL